jgi:hypothetical protein
MGARRWVLTGGLRHSRVSFDVDDRYLANGNDSGSVDYRHTTPLLGVLYKLTPTLNVYASAARGFETPTLNELFYSGAGAASISDWAPPPAPSWKPARKPCSAAPARQRRRVPGAVPATNWWSTPRPAGAHQLPQRQRHPAPGPGAVAR